MNAVLPCHRCPYKLGFIQTFTNPCPQCKLQGYKMFEVFISYTGYYGSEQNNDKSIIVKKK